METALFLAGSLSLVICLYPVFLRSGFRRADRQLDHNLRERRNWPGVAALIATGDDAEAIEETLPGLLEQAYPGAFHVILVDDHSHDGTVDAAVRAARTAKASQRLSVLSVEAPPAGWSRRTWALARAQEHAAANLPAVRYLWLVEPWVLHARYSLQSLVTKAEKDHCSLVSLLPLSACETLWDRVLAPAFAFLFQALHPVLRTDGRRHASAAAAPGSVLVKTDALEDAGGFAAWRDSAVLEDSLTGRMKSGARRNGHGVWLGLADDSTTVQIGHEWTALRNLALSTAEAQLRASPLRLAVGTAAIALACLVPPVVFLWALVAGFFLDIDQFLMIFLAILVPCASWALMCFAAWPTFELYGQEEWRTLLLPVAALAYIVLTMALSARIVTVAGKTGTKRATAPKDGARLPSGAARIEPELEVPSQAAIEPGARHAFRERNAQS